MKSVRHYWINREVDKKRRERMLKWLDERQIVNSRVNAITPDTLPRLAVYKGYEQSNSTAEYACLASHLLAILTAYRDGETLALIMEDDISSPFDCDLQQLAETAPEGWHILQLSMVSADGLTANYKAFNASGDIWQQWDGINWGTGAYLISRRGMREILDRFVRLESQGQGIAAIKLGRGRKYGKLVSDYVLYRYTATYACVFPLYVSDLELGSTLHDGHIEKFHAAAGSVVGQLHQVLLKLGGKQQYRRAFSFLSNQDENGRD